MLRAPQDLAVQREGTFILRYRAFDICSTTLPGGRDHPTLAELYGGPFRVYSTREFPGLEPSTDLTRVCGFFYLVYLLSYIVAHLRPAFSPFWTCF